KESYAVVGETLRAFATERHEEQIPIYRMLATPIDELRKRANDLARGTQCEVIDSDCALGGGTTPTETIASVAIHVPGKASDLYARFLEQQIGGRIVEDRFTVEVRTLLEEDLASLRSA